MNDFQSYRTGLMQRRRPMDMRRNGFLNQEEEEEDIFSPVDRMRPNKAVGKMNGSMNRMRGRMNTGNALARPYDRSY